MVAGLSVNNKRIENAKLKRKEKKIESFEAVKKTLIWILACRIRYLFRRIQILHVTTDQRIRGKKIRILNLGVEVLGASEDGARYLAGIVVVANKLGVVLLPKQKRIRLRSSF